MISEIEYMSYTYRMHSVTDNKITFKNGLQQHENYVQFGQLRNDFNPIWCSSMKLLGFSNIAIAK